MASRMLAFLQRKPAKTSARDTETMRSPDRGLGDLRPSASQRQAAAAANQDKAGLAGASSRCDGSPGLLAQPLQQGPIDKDSLGAEQQQAAQGKAQRLDFAKLESFQPDTSDSSRERSLAGGAHGQHDDEQAWASRLADEPRTPRGPTAAGSGDWAPARGGDADVLKSPSKRGRQLPSADDVIGAQPSLAASAAHDAIVLLESPEKKQRTPQQPPRPALHPSGGLHDHQGRERDNPAVPGQTQKTQRPMQAPSCRTPALHKEVLNPAKPSGRKLQLPLPIVPAAPPAGFRRGWRCPKPLGRTVLAAGVSNGNSSGKTASHRPGDLPPGRAEGGCDRGHVPSERTQPSHELRLDGGDDADEPGASRLMATAADEEHVVDLTQSASPPPTVARPPFAARAAAAAAGNNMCSADAASDRTPRLKRPVCSLSGFATPSTGGTDIVVDLCTPPSSQQQS